MPRRRLFEPAQVFGLHRLFRRNGWLELHGEHERLQPGHCDLDLPGPTAWLAKRYQSVGHRLPITSPYQSSAMAAATL